MKNNKSQNNNFELNPLNDELGSFGLEPPKRYKKEDDAKKVNNQRNKKASNKNSSQPKTKKEKMAANKKKRRLKKKFRVALGIIALSIMLVLIVAVCLVMFCKIETISIKGNEHYNKEQILAVLPIEKEKNLFFIDSDSAEEKLCQNLPYIYSVDIKRKLPSTIEVNISEVERCYYIQNSDNLFTYFDDNFKTIEVNVPNPPENGIEIKKLAIKEANTGLECTFTDDTLIEEVKELITIVKDLKLDEITAIYSESKHSNFLVYKNRIIIKIGDISNAEKKVYSALAAIEKLNEANPQAEGTMTSMGGKQVYFTEQK